MEKLTVLETKNIIGGARWYCAACKYESAWHVVMTTAVSYGNAHKQRRGHSVVFY